MEGSNKADVCVLFLHKIMLFFALDKALVVLGKKAGIDRRRLICDCVLLVET